MNDHVVELLREGLVEREQRRVTVRLAGQADLNRHKAANDESQSASPHLAHVGRCVLLGSSRYPVGAPDCAGSGGHSSTATLRARLTFHR